MIDLGDDVDLRDDEGTSPLWIASAAGHDLAVEALIEANADVSFADNFGSTPLFAAAQEGRTACARLLLQNGAEAGLSVWAAARQGHFEVARLLIAHGADVDKPSSDRRRSKRLGPRGTTTWPIY